MQQLFSDSIFSEGTANTLLASLTGAGLAVTLVLAAIILAAAVFAVISIVKRRKKNKGRCYGCGGTCSSCGISCLKGQDRNNSTAEKANSPLQANASDPSHLSNNDKNK